MYGGEIKKSDLEISQVAWNDLAKERSRIPCDFFFFLVNYELADGILEIHVKFS